MQISDKTVLVAPLNWGLGHATRCIAIINKLLELNCKVIIASDGAALKFLQQEFPELLCLELPSYNITYSKSSLFFKFKLFFQIFNVYQSVLAEKKIVANWVERYKIDILISDNRLGVISKHIPSVYITHQLNVMSGITTNLTTWFHKFFIKKFTYCWVPDYESSEMSLAGKLSCNTNIKAFKIGPLSHIKRIETINEIDIFFLVSGPEPQRSLLEKIFRREIEKNDHLKIVLVCGFVEDKQRIVCENGAIIYNFATSEQMQELLNASKKIVCRSGYSTIMDLSFLQKKALLIPTPGQDEQIYLAKYLKKQNFLPYVNQQDFTFEHLVEVDKYKGLPHDKPLCTILFNNVFT